MTPESPTRMAAYRAVAERPGSAIVDVAEQLGVDHSTASYHLRRLERRGRVVARPAGRSRAYFANGSGVCPYLQWALPRLRADAVAPALEMLLDTGEATVARLARGGVRASAARWALHRLEAAGVAERTGHGTYAIPDGRRACARRALDGNPCPEWGACAVSKAWRERPPAPALAREKERPPRRRPRRR